MTSGFVYYIVIDKVMKSKMLCQFCCNDEIEYSTSETLPYRCHSAGASVYQSVYLSVRSRHSSFTVLFFSSSHDHFLYVT